MLGPEGVYRHGSGALPRTDQHAAFPQKPFGSGLACSDCLCRGCGQPASLTDRVKYGDAVYHRACACATCLKPVADDTKVADPHAACPAHAAVVRPLAWPSVALVLALTQTIPSALQTVRGNATYCRTCACAQCGTPIPATTKPAWGEWGVCGSCACSRCGRPERPRLGERVAAPLPFVRAGYELERSRHYSCFCLAEHLCLVSRIPQWSKRMQRLHVPTVPEPSPQDRECVLRQVRLPHMRGGAGPG